MSHFIHPKKFFGARPSFSSSRHKKSAHAFPTSPHRPNGEVVHVTTRWHKMGAGEGWGKNKLAEEEEGIEFAIRGKGHQKQMIKTGSLFSPLRTRAQKIGRPTLGFPLFPFEPPIIYTPFSETAWGGGGGVHDRSKRKGGGSRNSIMGRPKFRYGDASEARERKGMPKGTHQWGELENKIYFV